jgi:DNA gyrase/topoisomerase IV subunit B
MKVYVKRENKVYYMEFDNTDYYHNPNSGKKPNDIITIDLALDKDSGTTIEFLPDFSIMEKND